MNLVHRVKKIIEEQRLIEPGERVLVGVSGGIDSTALLSLLLDVGKALSFDLGVAHINHLLRGEESLRDEEFVRNLARSLSLPCHVARIDVRKEAKEAGRSLQHAGRDVRYGFFSATAAENNYQKIAVAHTLDDQVETFVLRMLKGTGLKGLTAIPVKRDNIVRPLLGIARAEMEEYARSRSLSFVEDSSNEKVVYERNFIRKRIIPRMEELNPAFREKVFSLLKDLTEVNRTFDERAKDFVRTEGLWDGWTVSLDVKPMRELDGETRFRVVSLLLDRMEPGFIPLREHMRQIDNLLSGLRPNLTANLPHGITAKKIYGKLVITKALPSTPPKDVIPIHEGPNRLEPFRLLLTVENLPQSDTGERLPLGPVTALFDGDKLGPLRVRSFREGDRFVPLGMTMSVKLKDFFMSRKIPREERRHIPLLLSGDDIIWVVGLRIDDRFKATKGTGRKMKVGVEPLS